MKKIALLLVLALCLSSLAGVVAVAEGEPATPSLEIALYTVPMSATVSILYAVAADGYESFDGLKLLCDKGNGAEEILPAGVLEIGGKNYIIFRYDNLSAAEMDVDVTACVSYGGATGTPITYSVADFAAGYLAGSASADSKALVSAMLEYGAAVKAMLSAKS